MNLEPVLGGFFVGWFSHALLELLKSKKSTSRCNLENCKHQEKKSENIEQQPQCAGTAWMACDDASTRCVDGGVHEASLDWVIDPLTNTNEHDTNTEQKGMGVGNALDFKGQGSYRTRCAKCHKEVVPVLNLQPGVRFFVHQPNDTHPSQAGFARLELINWIAAALIAAALSMAYLLDGPSAVQERLDSAQASVDAAKAAQRQERFSKAAQAMCGANAGWRALDDGLVQCLTKRAHKTRVVQVTL